MIVLLGHLVLESVQAVSIITKITMQAVLAICIEFYGVSRTNLDKLWILPSPGKIFYEPSNCHCRIWHHKQDA